PGPADGRAQARHADTAGEPVARFGGEKGPVGKDGDDESPRRRLLQDIPEAVMDHRLPAGERQVEGPRPAELVEQPGDLLEAQLETGRRQGPIAVEIVAVGAAEVAAEGALGAHVVRAARGGGPCM